MSVTISEISVAFEGEISGVGELTWGQAGIWRQMRETGRTMNVVVGMALPAGVPVEEMTAALGFVVGRHAALRTRLRFAGDPSEGRLPQQVVAASGELPLQILDIDDAEDPEAVAEELRSRYELTPFDYEHEFPVRMGVVRRAGQLLRMVAGYHHLVTDGAGLEALGRDTFNLDRSTFQAVAPPQVLDPLKLAAAQGGPRGRAQNDKCLRYWAAQLDRLPDWRIVEPADSPRPRYRELAVYSPAMELSLRAIAARTKVASNYVLFAAYAVAVARVLGRNPNVVQPVVSNRFRPGFAGTVSQVSQQGICVIDVADASFDEVVGRAWNAATNASLHAYYDPRDRDRLLAQTEARRGAPLDVAWHLNDRRNMSVSGTQFEQNPLSEAELRAALKDALPRTKMYWDRGSSNFDGTLFLQVDSRPETDIPGRAELDEGLPAVFMGIWTDMQHFAPEQIEGFVREMEAVVAAAAFDAALPTGVSVPATL